MVSVEHWWCLWDTSGVCGALVVSVGYWWCLWDKVVSVRHQSPFTLTLPSEVIGLIIGRPMPAQSECN